MDSVETSRQQAARVASATVATSHSLRSPIELPPLPPGPPAWRVFRALVELRRAGPSRTQEKAARLAELCGILCGIHQIDVELRGQLPEAPSIVVANHLGYIDPLVLCSLMPLSRIASRVRFRRCVGAGIFFRPER